MFANVCQERQNTQAKETLEPHAVPTRPWQVVGTDLFLWDGDEYLLLCDYYSKFPIIKKIPQATQLPILQNVCSQNKGYQKS